MSIGNTVLTFRILALCITAFLYLPCTFSHSHLVHSRFVQSWHTCFSQSRILASYILTFSSCAFTHSRLAVLEFSLHTISHSRILDSHNFAFSHCVSLHSRILASLNLPISRSRFAYPRYVVSSSNCLGKQWHFNMVRLSQNRPLQFSVRRECEIT